MRGIIRRIKDFHHTTEEAWLAEEKSRLEPWKETVMHLHTVSRFLFYYEDSEAIDQEKDQILLVGELVKKEVSAELPLFLYDGQARLLGEGVMLGQPEEKMEKRSILSRPPRSQFLIRLTALGGESPAALSDQERKKRIGQLCRNLSLISDQKIHTPLTCKHDLEM